MTDPDIPRPIIGSVEISLHACLITYLAVTYSLELSVIRPASFMMSFIPIFTITKLHSKITIHDEYITFELNSE